jgi:hypothetical protein
MSLNMKKRGKMNQPDWAREAAGLALRGGPHRSWVRAGAEPQGDWGM